MPVKKTLTIYCYPLKSPIELFVIGKVKDHRRAAGISQASLADKLQLSKGFVGQVESRNNPAKYNLNHLNELARILNCRLGDFFPEEPFG